MSRTALLVDHEFGPAMQKLAIVEQMFVCNLFTSPKSITKAAEQAGVKAATRNALRVQAHKMLHTPRISEAVIEESKRRTVFLLPKAQRALENVLDNSAHADHFKAIKMVRDDGGASKVIERVLNVKVEVSQTEKIKTIIEFAKSHGQDPKLLLGFDPATIDAEFEEVDPTAAAEDADLGII